MHGVDGAHASSVCKRILSVQSGCLLGGVRGAQAAPGSNASISEGGDRGFRVSCVQRITPKELRCAMEFRSESKTKASLAGPCHD